MSAILAMVLGALGVTYAVWPSLRGAGVTRLADEPPEALSAKAEADAIVLRDWSVAAGELRVEAAAGQPRSPAGESET